MSNKQFKGIIYQVINIQNGKSYIGQTVKSLERRKQLHINLCNRGDKRYFYRSIRKYGEHNFKWIILGELFSDTKKELKDSLNKAEIECIIFFNSNNSIYGYNMTQGGDGGDTLSNHPDIENIKLKLKEKAKHKKQNYENILKLIEYNKNRPKKDYIKASLTRKNNGYSHSLETRKKIGKGGDKRRGENNPMYNKHHTNEAKKKMSLASKGRFKGTTKDDFFKINLSKKRIGKKNKRYIYIDYEFLILNYFKIMSIQDSIKIYNNVHNTQISGKVYYSRFLKILKFPSNTLIKNLPKKREIYIKFVEENKHNIQWYIDNYERLEEEFNDKKLKNKIKELKKN